MNVESLYRKCGELFNDLEFDEERHIYNVNNQIIPSVSKLIQSYYKPFDKSISKAVAQRRGVTQEQVLKEWEDNSRQACERGDKAHYFGERYAFDRNLQPTTPLEEAITNFWDTLPDYIVPFATELKMYHKDYSYAGTGDIILYNKVKESFLIADYKTNKDLFKNFRDQKLYYPFAHMLDTPFNKYQLQLSYYQLMLEQVGIPISKRLLLWLHDDATYDVYQMDDMTKEIEKELNSFPHQGLNE